MASSHLRQSCRTWQAVKLQSDSSLSSLQVRPRVLTVAIRIAMISLALAVALPMTLSYATEPLSSMVKKDYNIAPGPLGHVLAQFAAISGIFLSFDPAPLASIQSNGLQGSYSAGEGFATLLNGSGYELADKGDGYSLRRQTMVQDDISSTMISALPMVVVTTNIETALGPVNGYVAKRTVTGTKTDTPIIEVPQSISVITRDEMDARGVHDITEALRYVPGVIVDNYGYEGRGYEYVLMRGFDGLYTANYRDGLQQAAEGAYFSGMLTEPYGIERVDVLRGPSSILFGQGDAGGVVNRISKRPSDNPVREMGVEIGNFDRKQLTADLGGRLNEDGTLLYRVVALDLDTDTQVKYPNGQRASRDRQYLAPSLTWRPNADTSLTILADALKNRSNASPFYITTQAGGMTGLPIADLSFVTYEQDQFSLGYQFEHRFNNTWTLRQNARFAQQDMFTNELYQNGFLDPHTISRYSVSAVERLEQLLLDTQLQAKFSSGAIEHTMLFGVDWQRKDATLERHQGVAPNLDILNPVYGQYVPPPPFLYAATQRIDQLGFYLQDQIKFDDRWILTLGGRYDKAELETDIKTFGLSVKQDDAAFTGRAGLTYLMSNGWAPYVSYAESFNPVNAITYTNGLGKPFDPTEGKQYEIGVKYQPTNKRSLFTAALFDLIKKNVVTNDPIDPSIKVQTGEIRSRGLELEAKTEISHGLNLLAAYTYNDVKVERSNNGDQGNTPIQIPKSSASVWLDYALSVPGWEGFGIGGGVRYVGRRYGDAENTIEQPSFTLYDAVLHYQTGPWRLALNVSNLTNKKYVSSYSGGGFAYYVGSERSVIASAKYHF